MPEPQPAAAAPSSTQPSGQWPEPETAPSGMPRSRLQSAIEVGREGRAYAALYASFRAAFRNTGQLIPELVIIWQHGERLFFRVFDPSFTHTGEIFILRHQLFFVGEDDQRVDGLYCVVLNGVSGQKAFRLDGVMMTVTNDRQRTPGAATIVYQRLADLPDEDGPVPTALLTSISGRMRTALFSDQMAEIAGPAILSVIQPRVGTPREDGTTDHLLRQPLDRSIGASEVEMSTQLIADLQRVRAAFLDPEAEAALGLSLVIPPAQDQAAAG